MEGAQNPAVATPGAAVDPRVALSMSMHAAPGVYAVLVGSGMSTAAGVPTGWQVVQDVIRTVAAAEGVDPAPVADRPEEWWEGQGRGEPRYDTLLAALGTTDAARQALLRRYFDPSPDLGGPLQPSAGHDALAWLCATGRVRVVLTTNFDRLIERALDAAGVTPQVLASPESVDGMTPLVHAPVTVAKVHGDYAALGQRHTPEELGSYPPQWDRLLDRVFDEYGLLIVGWSAEYDDALVRALERAASRRFPMYWTSYKGDVRERARRLIAGHQASEIATGGADEFLGDLTERIQRLDARTIHRGRPASMRSYSYPPPQSTAPQGWEVLPLLMIRVAIALGPAPLAAVGILRPEHREQVLTTLRRAAFTTRLRGLSFSPPASARADPASSAAPVSASKVTDWEPAPHGYQSTEHASYRLGGDAATGVSALCAIQLPGIPSGASVLLTIDTAVSLAPCLRLGEAAGLARDALVLASADLPSALAEILPFDATPQQAEVHFLAAPTDGNNRTRPNDLEQRIDLSPLGTATRPIGPAMGFAAHIDGALTEREAGGLAADAVEHMALAHGFLDPRAGVQLVRAELGVAV